MVPENKETERENQQALGKRRAMLGGICLLVGLVLVIVYTQSDDNWQQMGLSCFFVPSLLVGILLLGLGIRDLVHKEGKTDEEGK